MGWTPITGFAATFDGNGNTISGLFIKRTTNDNGLFGTVTAAGKVRNVGLTGVNVSGGSRTGALAGSNSGAISGGYAQGFVTSTFSTAGGPVGENAGGTITASHAAVSINGGALSSRLGGLVGSLVSSGTITASYATGAISGHDGIGGLVGAVFSSGTITASYATGAISGNHSIGGLVGNMTLGAITASYSTGRVSGETSSNIGGPGRPLYHQNGNRQLLGHNDQRPGQQRRRHGQDDQRAANSHRLRDQSQHLRHLEPGPGRGFHQRRPLGLRRGHRLPAAAIRRPGPAHPARDGLRH